MRDARPCARAECRAVCRAEPHVVAGWEECFGRSVGGWIFDIEAASVLRPHGSADAGAGGADAVVSFGLSATG